MNGVEYIKSLGDDTKGTKSELIKEAKAKGFKSCVYSISLDGKSLAEGEGNIQRGAGLIFSDHGKKYTGCHQSGPIVALSLAMNPEGKVDRALKFTKTKDESRAIEKEMHEATDFIAERGDKSERLLDLWIEFCGTRNISEEALKAGVDFTSSSFDMFSDMKKAYRKGRNLGNVTKKIIDEIEAALGHKM